MVGDEEDGDVMVKEDCDGHASKRKHRNGQTELYAADSILLPGRRRAEKKRKKKARSVDDVAVPLPILKKTYSNTVTTNSGGFYSLRDSTDRGSEDGLDHGFISQAERE